MTTLRERSPIEKFFARVNESKTEDNAAQAGTENDEETRKQSILQLRDRTKALLSIHAGDNKFPEGIEKMDDMDSYDSYRIVNPSYIDLDVRYKGQAAAVTISSSVSPSSPDADFIAGKVEINVSGFEDKIVLIGTNAFIQKKENPGKRKAEINDLHDYINSLDVVESHGTIIHVPRQGNIFPAKPVV